MRKTIYLIFSLFIGTWVLQAQTYTENFDSYSDGTVPDGWTSYTTQSDDPGFLVMQEASIAHSPDNMLAHKGVDLEQESTSWIVSPAIDLSDNQQLEFYWREKWSFAYNYSGVYISTGSNDPINNPDDFVELAEFNPDDYPDTWNEWNRAVFDLRPYADQTVYIAFKYVGDFGHDFYVDDFSVGDIPVCAMPENVRMVDHTETSVMVAWNPVEGADTYEIVWGEPGFDVESATPVEVENTYYNIENLEPSTYYDVYVRTVCSDFNQSYWYGPVAVYTAGPPPAYDTCDGAVLLTAGTECNPTVFYNTWATDSGVEDPGCASYEGNDVWAKVVVPETGDLMIQTTPVEGSEVHDTGLAVYSGSCGELNLIECDDDGGSGFFSGILIVDQTPGDTLYIRAWEYGNDRFGPFGICAVAMDIQPPANDTCDGAISLEVGQQSCGTMAIGDNTFATDSGIGSPGCANYHGGDLWFSAVVPESGSLVVETKQVDGSDVSDTGMAAYSGDCSNLTLIECNDDGGDGLFSKVELSGLNPGETIYIRVWEYGNNSFGEIGVCAYNPDVSVASLSAMGFSLYPNPAHDHLSMKADTPIEKVILTNMAGQVVKEWTIGAKSYTVDISQLPAGIYLLKVQINGEQGTYRLIKE